MLSSSWISGLAVLATPRISPVRSTTATCRNGLSIDATARVRIVLTSPAVSGTTAGNTGRTGSDVELPLHDARPSPATVAAPATDQTIRLRVFANMERYQVVMMLVKTL